MSRTVDIPHLDRVPPGVRASSVKRFSELYESVARRREARRRVPGSAPGQDVDTIVSRERGRTVVAGDIPPRMDIRQGQRFLFLSRDQAACTHGVHKYPAKFFPELPRFLIRRYSRKGSSVLDPFAGSGTTNLEAMLAGRPSVAVDVDPFSRFLVRVKTTPLRPGLATQAALLCVDGALRREGDRRKPPQVPEFPYREGWFAPHALEELSYIRRVIREMPRRVRGRFSKAQVEAARDLMLAAMSSIVRETSNADNNCTRTVVRKNLGKQVPPGLGTRLFVRKAVACALGAEELASEAPEVRVQIPGDAEARSIPGPAGRFSLAVTSPPYCNAVDYPRTHQLEMYWLGIASGSLQTLKRRHVGTEVVRAQEYDRLQLTGIDGADRVIRRIYRQDPRRAYILYRYLDDMQRNLLEVKRVLRRRGRYCIAVGNNLMRGQVVENWRYIASMGQRAGFSLETWFGSDIIRHFIKVPRRERIDTDWVIVLRKR